MLRQILILSVPLVLTPLTARAYIDPGTGSFFLQILFAGMLGSLLVILDLWKKMRMVFKRLRTILHRAAYPYIGTLENPYSYQFSNFSGRKFIDAYKKSRSRMLKSLKMDSADLDKLMQNYIGGFANLEKEDALQSILQKQDTKTKLALLVYLQKRFDQDEQALTAVYKWLSIFIKKYEVFKKIFSQYGGEMKKIGDDYKDIENYLLLAINLAFYFQKSKNLKFMNALLKINDMLCGMKNQMELKILPLFYWCLKIELDGIKDLFKKKGLKL